MDNQQAPLEDAAKEYNLSDEGQRDILVHLKINQIVENLAEGKIHPYYAKVELFNYFKSTWQANQLPGVWAKEKPEFTDDCFLLTATEINGQHHYNAWSINKIFSHEGFYWGWCTMDGEEYGDIADLKADLYKVISAPFAKMANQLPGVEECIAKAIEMGIEDIRDQFKELINFAQGKK